MKAQDIVSISCPVGEGTVHRLWEPLAVKHRPQTPYAAKFSTPFCMAIAFLDGKAGLSQFDEAHITDAAARELAAKISYVIDPNDPYPDQFIGALKATLRNGEVREIKQGYMRGGSQAPMTQQELETKFIDNAVYGGWSNDQAEEARKLVSQLFDAKTPASLRQLRN